MMYVLCNVYVYVNFLNTIQAKPLWIHQPAWQVDLVRIV